MKREKGLTYCGLACSLCPQNDSCAGCRNEGCKNREWCKNFNCCRQKGIAGCWECESFPCEGSMHDKVRARAFAMFIKKYGVEKMLDCLERNEKKGIIYHYKDSLMGDYDIPKTEDAIISLLLNGEKSKN